MGSVTSQQVNRYPDPHHKQLKEEWSKIRNIATDRIFFGNGSDEPIDLLIRLFCDPMKDHLITMPPTYGMYQVSAAINNVENLEIPLSEDFHIDLDAFKDRMDENSRMIFICSPNNPTGNLLDRESIEEILKFFPGMVVIDEAYLDFSEEPSWIGSLEKYRNLVVMQTMSKAWGMAGIRVGAAMADPYVISMLEKIKPPYNLSLPNQQLAFEAMQNTDKKDEEVRILLSERKRTEQMLQQIPQVEKIFPSDANFVLVRFEAADEIFKYLIDEKVIVRNRSKQRNCENCLRITIGKEEENDQLIKLINQFYKN